MCFGEIGLSLGRKVYVSGVKVGYIINIHKDVPMTCCKGGKDSENSEHKRHFYSSHFCTFGQ